MNIQPWVPASIAERVSEYERQITEISNGDISYNDAEKFISEIWIRLATRPEMHAVWTFISQFGEPSKLVSNGGMLGIINRNVRRYFSNPKLTPVAYKDEMVEIAKLADMLARKLSKFSNIGASQQNLFTLHAMLSDLEFRRASELIDPAILSTRSLSVGAALNSFLPRIDEQLRGLASHARSEASEQMYRLRLPRKVNDKHTFRTYFIRNIADYFFTFGADYSPTRISIFCSVALDDADITPDLVSKLCPLDHEQKRLLREQADWGHQED